MTAPVRIEAKAWGDQRFATLARALGARVTPDLGLSLLEVGLMRCAKLWSWQTDNYSPDSPTYVVDLDTIESVLGDGGAAALVRAKLATETPDGYRIHGSVDRVEWLWKRQQASANGGEATKRKWANKGGPAGLPNEGQTKAETKAERGLSSSSSSSSEKNQNPELPPPAGARDPSPPVPAPGGTQAPSDAGSAAPARVPSGSPVEALTAALVMRLAVTAWRHAHELHAKSQALDPSARNPWGGIPTKCMADFRARVLELLEAGNEAHATAEIANRIEVAFAEAETRNPPSLRYTAPSSMWRKQSFDFGSDLTPEQVRASTKHQSRAGPRSAAPQNVRVGRVEPQPASAYTAGERKL